MHLTPRIIDRQAHWSYGLRNVLFSDAHLSCLLLPRQGSTLLLVFEIGRLSRLLPTLETSIPLVLALCFAEILAIASTGRVRRLFASFNLDSITCRIGFPATSRDRWLDSFSIQWSQLMTLKRKLQLLAPQQRRTVPKSFGWIDHRLRSSGLLARLRPEDMGLYLFLLLAADQDGLSCWRLDRIERELAFDHAQLWSARQRLGELGLIAYRPWSHAARDGSYQVLEIRPKVDRQLPSVVADLTNIGQAID